MYILTHWQTILAVAVVACCLVVCVYSLATHGGCTVRITERAPDRVPPVLKAIPMSQSTQSKPVNWFTDNPDQGSRILALLRIAGNGEPHRVRNIRHVKDLMDRQVITESKAESVISKMLDSPNNGADLMLTVLLSIAPNDFDYRDFYPMLSMFAASPSPRKALAYFYEGTIKPRENDPESVKVLREVVCRALLEHMRNLVCSPQRIAYNDYFVWAIIARVGKELSHENVLTRVPSYYFTAITAHIDNIRKEYHQ